MRNPLALLAALVALLLPRPLLVAADKPEAPKPDVDPNRIINESYRLLKEREPDMTETEFALYERVVPMISAQPDFALRLLEGMIGEAESSPAFELVLGNVYFEQKRYADAEARFKAAIDKYPTFARAWENLAVLYFTLERYAEAVPSFNKAISLGQSEPRLFGLLAFCLLKSGHAVAAEQAYLQAMVMEPDNGDWIEGLLGTYFDSGQYARAEAMLRRLVKLKPRQANFWLLLGNTILSQGRKLDAIAELAVARSLGVLDQDGLMLLGDLYAEQRMRPEAFAAYSALAEKNTDLGVERMLRYASVLVGESRGDEASALLAEVKERFGDSHRTGVLLAQANLHASRQEWAEARTLLGELLEREPLHGQALFEYARAAEALGDDAQAQMHYESAARMSEQAYAASLKLANLHVRLGHYEDALEWINKAIALESSPALTEFRARVLAVSGPSE